MLTSELLDAYAAVLSTLGRFHREAPDETTLSAFGELLDDWPLEVSEGARAGLEKLRQSFQEGESAYRIKADLNRLYGVSAKALIAPFESVHRDRDGLVFDRQTLLVRERYRQLGLEVARLNREPDDHVGVEMDFVAQCLLRALDQLDADNPAAAEEYLRVLQDFLDQHVNQWAPEMLGRAAELADTRFNQGLCLLSVAALKSLTESV